mmetsp:Transcript_1801/g.2508  ORF Transcript_1801/g.2508 Transcript_1801/m.2508 type:complete len:316 (-) Transcript_1801:431-1378(-)
MIILYFRWHDALGSEADEVGVHGHPADRHRPHGDLVPGVESGGVDLPPGPAPALQLVAGPPLCGGITDGHGGHVLESSVFLLCSLRCSNGTHSSTSHRHLSKRSANEGGNGGVVSAGVQVSDVLHLAAPVRLLGLHHLAASGHRAPAAQIATNQSDAAAHGVRHGNLPELDLGDICGVVPLCGLVARIACLLLLSVQLAVLEAHRRGTPASRRPGPLVGLEVRLRQRSHLPPHAAEAVRVCVVVQHAAEFGCAGDLHEHPISIGIFVVAAIRNKFLRAIPQRYIHLSFGDDYRCSPTRNRVINHYSTCKMSTAIS